MFYLIILKKRHLTLIIGTCLMQMRDVFSVFCVVFVKLQKTNFFHHFTCSKIINVGQRKNCHCNNVS